MPNIKPVSDLRNDTDALKEADASSRVYLRRNGHGVYGILVVLLFQIDHCGLSDNELNAEIAQFMLTDSGAEVVTAQNGMVVLTDIKMQSATVSHWLSLKMMLIRDSTRSDNLKEQKIYIFADNCLDNQRKSYSSTRFF